MADDNAQQPPHHETGKPPAHENERERQNREFWRALHEAERQGVPEMGTATPGSPRPAASEHAPSPELEERERRQANTTHESDAE